MTWLPWLLLLGLIAVVTWGIFETTDHVRWARQALTRDDAGQRPLRLDSWVIRSLGIDELFKSVALRAKEERAVRSGANRRIEALLSPLTDAVLVIDHQDRLRLANPAAIALFRLSEADIGGPAVPLVRNADLIELIRRVRQGDDARSTLLLNRSPLADVWVQVAGARTDPEVFGEPATIFVLADVTTLKRLQSLEREFVTNVSHDLRTPVTILRGYAETLAEEHATMAPADRERFTKKLVASVGRLQTLVEGLLALASLETSRLIELVPGALHATVREVAAEFAPRLRAANVELELRLTADEDCAADPIQARRMIQNLIDNALAHAVGLSRLIVSTRASLDGVELVIEDDGAGVPATELPRLFDRFYRTDKSRQAGGSGLGLSIVRQVAELHGGKATGESVLPKGLRIVVTLPVRQTVPFPTLPADDRIPRSG